MKFFLKNILVFVLGWQIRRLRNRHNFKIIGVVGSIGKTSTKLAVAKVLAANSRVRYQEGNYNDIVSVPLVVFGHEMPALWNVFAWLKLILKNELQIWLTFPFDFVVLELGTDGPGQISEFRKYLHIDLAVLTAVAPEHMEFFENIDNVSEEEWSISYFSDLVAVNRDLVQKIPENIDHRKIIFYGKGSGSVYKMENIIPTSKGFDFELKFNNENFMRFSCEVLSEVELYSFSAAAIVAHNYGFSAEKIKDTIEKIESFSGRMQKLKGIKNSLIIDDTYNASPLAIKMALDALYKHPLENKMAILGMMNELGVNSKEEHEKIGDYCDPKRIYLLVTIGKDANDFLAPRAEKKGVKIYKAKNSKDAGEFVLANLRENSVILAKGSQNRVFTEEALKPILKDKKDEKKLVRQDKTWMKKKVDFWAK